MYYTDGWKHSVTSLLLQMKVFIMVGLLLQNTSLYAVVAWSSWELALLTPYFTALMKMEVVGWSSWETRGVNICNVSP